MSKTPEGKNGEIAETQDNVMGIRTGGGPDQYGGSYAGGQSGGGPYASPHLPDADDGDRSAPGNMAQHGYHGGGQAGPKNSSEIDHYAADQNDADTSASIDDHPSQRDGQAMTNFNAKVQGR